MTWAIYVYGLIMQEMLWQNNLDMRMVSHLLLKQVETNLKHILKATRN